jgi:hypothetical protein
MAKKKVYMVLAIMLKLNLEKDLVVMQKVIVKEYQVEKKVEVKDK